MASVSRRRFCAGAAALPLAVAGRTQPPSRGRPPLPHRIVVSCNLYSFNRPLTTGAMTLPQVLDYCAEIGFEAVDPTGYYFAGYPAPPSSREILEIKHRAFRLGLEISGTGIRTDFAVADADRRADDERLTVTWLDVAARLGAPMLRIFAGHGRPGGGVRWGEARKRVLGSLDTIVEAAAERGVAIVLQNHEDVLRTAAEVLDIRTVVRSEWFGLNVDIGSLRTADPYDEIARLAPYAYTWQIKESVYRRGREEPTDLGAIVRILRETGYRGYVPLETLGAGDPRPKIRRHLDNFRQALA